MYDDRTESVVYFVRIDRHIKIGVTTKLEARIKAFETSSNDVTLLHFVLGDQTMERRIHRLLAESHITRELFRPDHRIQGFINISKAYGLPRAIRYLEESSPAERAKKKEEDRLKRVAEARLSKAEKDAYFASLVADRKQRLGW